MLSAGLNPMRARREANRASDRNESNLGSTFAQTSQLISQGMLSPDTSLPRLCFPCLCKQARSSKIAHTAQCLSSRACRVAIISASDSVKGGWELNEERIANGLDLSSVVTIQNFSNQFSLLF